LTASVYISVSRGEDIITVRLYQYIQVRTINNCTSQALSGKHRFTAQLNPELFENNILFVYAKCKHHYITTET